MLYTVLLCMEDYKRSPVYIKFFATENLFHHRTLIRMILGNWCQKYTSDEFALITQGGFYLFDIKREQTVLLQNFVDVENKHVKNERIIFGIF